MDRIRAEDFVGEEWAEWYRLTQQQRWAESEKMWETYLALGGSLEPEPDSQSPFFDPDEWRENLRTAPSPCAADGRPCVRIVRRGGVR